MQNHETIPIHDSEAFDAMRQAGKAAAELLDALTPYVVPGVLTSELDDLAVAWAAERGYTHGPLNYRGYPKSICVSPNHVVCHGIPGNKRLVEGDIVNIDVTPVVQGWFGDSSRMYYVGRPGVKARKLVETTYECLMRAIDCIRPGARLGDVGAVIQACAEAQRFSVVKDFCGHGIGREFHCAPSVLHYGQAGTGIVLEEGMIFTVEPMINAGKAETKTLADGWTAVTRDKSLSAQFEHTVGVSGNGCEVFTFSPKGWNRPPYV